MKNIIINTLILILMFNIIMIIFPDGKTQKFCRIAIKIFVMIYILDNIFLNGSIDFNSIIDIPTTGSAYEREISVSTIDREFIDSINENLFEGMDVVKNITLVFTENMDVEAVVQLNKLLSTDEIDVLKTNLAEALNIGFDNVRVE